MACYSPSRSTGAASWLLSRSPKNTPDTEAVDIKDQMLHKRFSAFEANLKTASVGEIDAITLVVSIEDPRAPTFSSAPTHRGTSHTVLRPH